MTAVDDLAAWLTQIWDEGEALAQAAVADPANIEVGPEAEPYFNGPGDPAAVLARIAADRQILALHSPNQPATQPWCDTDQLMWPCRTVRLLALPHADRPGYQEAWRPA